MSLLPPAFWIRDPFDLVLGSPKRSVEPETTKTEKPAMQYFLDHLVGDDAGGCRRRRSGECTTLMAGDRVRVTGPNLYGLHHKYMLDCIGEVFTVAGTRENGDVSLQGSRYTWHPAGLELVHHVTSL